MLCETRDCTWSTPIVIERSFTKFLYMIRLGRWIIEADPGQWHFTTHDENGFVKYLQEAWYTEHSYLWICFNLPGYTTKFNKYGFHLHKCAAVSLEHWGYIIFGYEKKSGSFYNVVILTQIGQDSSHSSVLPCWNVVFEALDAVWINGIFHLLVNQKKFSFHVKLMDDETSFTRSIILCHTNPPRTTLFTQKTKVCTTQRTDPT